MALERRNEGFSRELGAASVIIEALGVLFAAGAIAAAFLIYRQSRDFQAERENERQSHQERVDQITKSGEDLIATATARFEEERTRSTALFDGFLAEAHSSVVAKLSEIKDRSEPNEAELLKELEAVRLRVDRLAALAVDFQSLPSLENVEQCPGQSGIGRQDRFVEVEIRRRLMHSPPEISGSHLARVIRNVVLALGIRSVRPVRSFEEGVWKAILGLPPDISNDTLVAFLGDRLPNQVTLTATNLATPGL